MENWLLLQIQISIVILAALVLRGFMSRLPKVYSYTLWLVVFLRLLCPWNIESPVSLIPSEEHLEAFLGWDNDVNSVQYKSPDAALQMPSALQSYWQGTAPPQTALLTNPGIISPENNQADTADNMEDAPSLQMPSAEQDSVDLLPGILSGILSNTLTNFSSKLHALQKILFGIWVAGVLTLWLFNFSSLHRIQRNLKSAVLLEENVWTSNMIRTPFVLGWLKPRIYLPCSLQGKEREYVLCHEKTHIRRKDYLIKNFAFLLTTLYWYHPFVWLAFYFLGQDMEMSCDEVVIKQLGSDIKKQYSQSLLNFAAGSQMSSATPLAFGENGVKQRVKNVLAYKSAKKWIGIIGIVLVVAAGAALLTTRANAGSPADNSGPENTPSEIVSGENVPEENRNTDLLQPTSSENDSDENQEVYEEYQAPDGTVYQVRENGIFEVSPAGTRQLTSVYIGTSPQLQLYGDRLYFMTNVTTNVVTNVVTDVSDTARENYFYNGIGWADPKSGTDGIVNLGINDAITDFWVYGGYIQCRLQGEDDFSPERHIFILPDDTEMLQLEKLKAAEAEAEALLQKTKKENELLEVTKKKEEQLQALNQARFEQLQQIGSELSLQLTQNPGTLLEVGYHTTEQITAWLDLDMDGTVEEITIMHDPDVDESYGYVPLDYYVLSAGTGQLNGFAYNMYAGIYAVSLDGATIQLVLYEDGPSADPLSHIIRYQSGQLVEAGTIEDDIRLREITAEGEIISHIFYYGIQDDYRVVTWQLNKSGKLEEIPQNTYKLVSQNEITLLKNLPVRSMPVPQEGIYSGIMGYTIEPQTVRFIAVSSDGNWVQLEAENGQQGWFQIEDATPPMWGYIITELGIGADEVFEGLTFLAG